MGGAWGAPKLRGGQFGAPNWPEGSSSAAEAVCALCWAQKNNNDGWALIATHSSLPSGRLPMRAKLVLSESSVASGQWAATRRQVAA